MLHGYWIFQWTTDFNEEEEHVLVPVWLELPGLPPNFYHEAFLKSVRTSIGVYLRRENATRCATRTDGLGCVL